MWEVSPRNAWNYLSLSITHLTGNIHAREIIPGIRFSISRCPSLFHNLAERFITGEAVENVAQGPTAPQDQFFYLNQKENTFCWKNQNYLSTPFMVLSVTYTICKGPNLDARGLKVSHPLNAYMIPFINIKTSSSEKISTLRHLDDSLAF